MEKLFLVFVLAGLGLGVWKMFGAKKKTSVNTQTGGSVSGDTSGNGNTSGRRDDGSLLPPGSGNTQI